MKKFLLLLGLTLPFALLSNSITPQSVNSNIDHVTVYRNGAQVLRKANFQLKAGMNEVVIPGLSQRLDDQSIQIKSKADFVLMSIKTMRNHMHPVEESQEILDLKNELVSLESQLQEHRALLEILNEQETLIKENRRIFGTNNGLEIIKLKEALALYNEELKEIKFGKISQNKEIKTLNEQFSKIQKQINEIRNENGAGQTMDLHLSILSDKAQNVDMDFSYLVNNASWSSTYDLKVKNIQSPMKIITKGMIRQATGENWDNVSLTLSTGNPRRSTYKPTLGPWWLQFYTYKKSKDYYVDGVEAGAPQTRNFRADAAEIVEENYTTPYTEISENTISMEFAIKERFSISPNNRVFTVLLSESEIDADYVYHTAPKLSPNAFLTASITDWEDLNLSTGTANLYFEDSYLGKSQINTINTADSLVISLGMDIGVAVERTKQKKYSEKRLIGTKKKATIGWEINVKNNKTEEIEIIISDQIPLSADSDIEIIDVEVGNAKLNKETGILTWKLTLQPGEKINKVFKYTVRYPKNKNLRLE